MYLCLVYNNEQTKEFNVKYVQVVTITEEPYILIQTTDEKSITLNLRNITNIILSE